MQRTRRSPSSLRGESHMRDALLAAVTTVVAVIVWGVAITLLGL
jgi:hypothetical protein